MNQIVFKNAKDAIVKASNNKINFYREVVKASNDLLPYQKEALINWLFFFTADKPETQKWLYELLENKI
jgi:hypothetical protein